MGGLTPEMPQSPLRRIQGGVEAMLKQESREKLMRVMEGFGPEAQKAFARTARALYESAGGDPGKFGQLVDALRAVRDEVMETVPSGSTDKEYAAAVERLLEELETSADARVQQDPETFH